MMTKSIINKLLFKKTWQAFYDEKDKFHRLNNQEKRTLKEIIATKSYKSLTKAILAGSYCFSTPRKIVINKVNVERKRIVYSYTLVEQLWLKVLAKELRIYSPAISSVCFSSPANGGAKAAFRQIISDKELKNKYAYKIDIANYFNSIDCALMLELVAANIPDAALLRLLTALLGNPYVSYRGELLNEQKGIMAGTPLSSFLANLYLKEMDEYFFFQQINYARYADDIIIFAYRQQLDEVMQKVDFYLAKYHLRLNSEKTKIIEPGSAFDFLGFNYRRGMIDLSSATILKTKKKIRRAARSLRRAQIKKAYSLEKALTLLITKFNRKFFLVYQDTDLNWTLWYFPLLNTQRSLKIIDNYFQQELRYLCSGSHTKKNYKKITYYYLKQLGYRSLVNEYHKFNKRNRL